MTLGNDEPSLGLSPRLVGELAGLIKNVVEEFKTAVLLVEQNASVALGVANRGYVLQSGRIELAGSSDEIRQSLARENLYMRAQANASA